MDRLAFRPQIEVLESKEAPAALTVTPPQGSAEPPGATIADLACTNGIDAHANAASSGVVACG
jgi:glutamate/tyrosine decarboxylase-like PLP-dependent enzyme